MKTGILALGIAVAGMPHALGQGYIDFSFFGPLVGNTTGIQVGPRTGICSQMPGWYLAGDYSVEAWMAYGANQPRYSLSPIAATKTVFIGGPTTTAAGSPYTDGSGLFDAGYVNTGLYPDPGIYTIQVRAWYDPNHNLSWEQANSRLSNVGESALYNINVVDIAQGQIPQSLDEIGLKGFTVNSDSLEPVICPEPSTLTLGCLGLGVLLIFTQKKPSA